MSQHNPELKPPQPVDPNAPIQPNAPDFIETPDLPPTSQPSEAIPFWIYLVCGFALFMSGSSFVGFSVFGQGGYDKGPGGPLVATGKTTAAVVITDPMVLGKKVYDGNCASCHQASGEGQPGTYPPMGGSEWVLGDKERLAALMLHGLDGPITVRGATYDGNVMPAWSQILSDNNIADVMTYMRGSWGNKEDAATAEEVAAARTKFASKTTPFKEAELLQIAPNPAK